MAIASSSSVSAISISASVLRATSPRPRRYSSCAAGSVPWLASSDRRSPAVRFIPRTDVTLSASLL